MTELCSFHTGNFLQFFIAQAVPFFRQRMAVALAVIDVIESTLHIPAPAQGRIDDIPDVFCLGVILHPGQDAFPWCKLVHDHDVVGRVGNALQDVIFSIQRTDDGIQTVEQDILGKAQGIHEGTVVIIVRVPGWIEVLDHLGDCKAGSLDTEQFFLLVCRNVRHLFQGSLERIIAVVSRVNTHDQGTFQALIDLVIVFLRAVLRFQNFTVIFPPDKAAGRIRNVRAGMGAVGFLVFGRMVVQFSFTDIKDDPAILVFRNLRIRSAGDFNLLAHQGNQSRRKDIIRMKNAIMGI